MPFLLLLAYYDDNRHQLCKMHCGYQCMAFGAFSGLFRHVTSKSNFSLLGSDWAQQLPWMVICGFWQAPRTFQRWEEQSSPPAEIPTIFTHIYDFTLPWCSRMEPPWLQEQTYTVLLRIQFHFCLFHFWHCTCNVWMLIFWRCCAIKLQELLPLLGHN